jgi:hypothetical protein
VDDFPEADSIGLRGKNYLFVLSEPVAGPRLCNPVGATPQSGAATGMVERQWLI